MAPSNPQTKPSIITTTIIPPASTSNPQKKTAKMTNFIVGPPPNHTAFRPGKSMYYLLSYAEVQVVAQILATKEDFQSAHFTPFSTLAYACRDTVLLPSECHSRHDIRIYLSSKIMRRLNEFNLNWLMKEPSITVIRFMFLNPHLKVKELPNVEVWEWEDKQLLKLRENVSEEEWEMVEELSKIFVDWFEKRCKQYWQKFGRPGYMEEMTGKQKIDLDDNLRDFLKAENLDPKDMILNDHSIPGPSFGSTIVPDRRVVIIKDPDNNEVLMPQCSPAHWYGWAKRYLNSTHPTARIHTYSFNCITEFIRFTAQKAYYQDTILSLQTAYEAAGKSLPAEELDFWARVKKTDEARERTKEEYRRKVEAFLERDAAVPVVGAPRGERNVVEMTRMPSNRPGELEGFNSRGLFNTWQHPLEEIASGLQTTVVGLQAIRNPVAVDLSVTDSDISLDEPGPLPPTHQPPPTKNPPKSPAQSSSSSSSSAHQQSKMPITLIPHAPTKHYDFAKDRVVSTEEYNTPPPNSPKKTRSAIQSRYCTGSHSAALLRRHAYRRYEDPRIWANEVNFRREAERRDESPPRGMERCKEGCCMLGPGKGKSKEEEEGEEEDLFLAGEGYEGDDYYREWREWRAENVKKERQMAKGL